MKKIRIITPENIEIEYTLADLGSRVAAAAIDMIIKDLIVMVMVIGLLLSLYYNPSLWEEHYGWILGIAFIVYAIISYGYFMYAELKMNGRTPGKKFLKLRTIRNSGEPITFKHSALRNLFKITIDSYGIGIAFIFFNKEHKRIGDLVASTMVIMEDEKDMPITLESLQNSKEHYSYYITEEEDRLLREYFERKSTLEDYTKVREEMKSYFTEKFQNLGILEEWQEFINRI
ncbi:RDD family protein [Clostridium polynesiense]|uniref:RDD family protein n=1 Tax=Clostridium polynesiense TaxID=1325933 RepID=UPI00058D7E29|nr:RDD family protein [Clostridium polynesiense]